MDCDATTFTEAFMDTLRLKALERRIPIKGGIEITQRCNLYCKHCYLGPQDIVHKTSDHELDTKTWKKILDDITEAGCLQLLITGGEPLIRKDFIELYQHAAQNGLIIILFTNGTLISDKILDVLQAFPPFEIEITLYGATEATYENVTGVPGSYKQCMHGIEKLIAAKLPLKLKTMVMTLNQHEFFAMEQLAKDLGVKFRHDCIVLPCLDGDQTPLQYRIKPEEVIDIDFAHKENDAKWCKQHAEFGGSPASDTLYNCGAGRINFHIDPFGNLMPCITTIAYQYNLLQGSFADCWNNFIPREFLAKSAPHDFACAKCAKRFLCSFCPATFDLQNNSETELVEYMCQIGHLRADQIEKIKK